VVLFSSFLGLPTVCVQPVSGSSSAGPVFLHSAADCFRGLLPAGFLVCSGALAVLGGRSRRGLPWPQRLILDADRGRGC